MVYEKYREKDVDMRLLVQEQRGLENPSSKLLKGWLMCVCVSTVQTT